MFGPLARETLCFMSLLTTWYLPPLQKGPKLQARGCSAGQSWADMGQTWTNLAELSRVAHIWGRADQTWLDLRRSGQKWGRGKTEPEWWAKPRVRTQELRAEGVRQQRREV